MTHTVAIGNDAWSVEVLPSAGGSVRVARARLSDEWVEVTRATAEDKLDDPWATASFPLVPWSNRIVDGRFPFGGKDREVRVNFADGTAIHGTALDFPWSVEEQSATAVTLHFDSRDVADANWPWPFEARLGYAVVGNRFTWTMAVTNRGEEPFPAGLGHHPYFLRRLAIGEPVLFQLNCDTYYPAIGCIPTDPPSPLDERVDFRVARPLGTAFVDDCWTDRTSPVFATLEYPGALRLTIEADEAFGHGVVYIPDGGEDTFCVEPVTHANNGVNLLAQGEEGTGVVTLAPGETLAASFTLVAQPLA